jgi:protein-S-isoprenylcysteine O-methyltransferase Ste14
VLAQFLLMTTVVVLAAIFPGGRTHMLVTLTGTVLLAAGAFFGIAGVRALGRNLTPFPRPRPGSELVRHGIYAHVRHPLYACLMLASLGWALVWQSAAASLAALALIPFFRAKARREEQWLRDHFPGYAEYEHQVPRFVPRLRHTTGSNCNH